MSTLSVTVTAEHITRARELLAEEWDRPSYCPVSLALRDCGWDYAFVDGATAWRDGEPGPGATESRPLPEDARGFIRDFDHNRPVAPITFDLPLSEEAS